MTDDDIKRALLVYERVRDCVAYCDPPDPLGLWQRPESRANPSAILDTLRS